ncbi:hypothetical protein pb186bvf_009246 [Paramecium bursaria]
MKSQNENIQVAKKVICKRRTILLKTAPQEYINLFMKSKTIQLAEQEINKLYGLQNDIIQLLTQYLIKFSKIWELHSRDSINKLRFKKVNFEEIHFKRFYHYFEVALKNLPQLEQFLDSFLLEQVETNIKINIKVVQFIVQLELSEKDIDQYFQEQEFFIFQGQFADHLLGLSSYDGKRVYISELIFQDYKQLKIQVIETQIMDNIYFWKTKNRNTFVIMGDINQKMVNQFGDQLEAGDYYLQEVYLTIIWQPSSFRMSTRNAKLFY